MAIIGVLFYLQSRLKPGRMLLVDTEEKRIIQDVELKLQIARSRPHSKWLKEQVAKRALFVNRDQLFVIMLHYIVIINNNYNLSIMKTVKALSSRYLKRRLSFKKKYCRNFFLLYCFSCVTWTHFVYINDIFVYKCTTAASAWSYNYICQREKQSNEFFRSCLH